MGERRKEEDKGRLWLRQAMNIVSFKGFPVLEFGAQSIVCILFILEVIFLLK